MKNDFTVVEWFNRQISSKGISNIYLIFDIFTTHFHTNSVAIHETTQSIRQDMQRIFNTMDRLYSMESKDENGIAPLSGSKKKNYQSADVEYILQKYQSVLAYCADLTVLYLPDAKVEKSQRKYHHIFGVMQAEAELNKHLLSSSWYANVCKTDPNTFSHGLSCIMFENKSLGLQLYGRGNQFTFLDDSCLKMDDAVYYADRFMVVHMAYLYYFLDRLFVTLLKINNKQYESATYDFKRNAARKEYEDSRMMSLEILTLPGVHQLKRMCAETLPLLGGATVRAEAAAVT